MTDQSSIGSTGSTFSRADVDGARRLTVSLDGVTDAASRDELLTAGVFEVIEFLNEATAAGREADAAAAVIVDVVVPARGGSPANSTAFVHAVSGLVQSLTLELPVASAPINVVVSTPGQGTERDRTVAYLAGDTGSFSRGSTYDLTGDAR